MNKKKFMAAVIMANMVTCGRDNLFVPELLDFDSIIAERDRMDNIKKIIDKKKNINITRRR